MDSQGFVAALIGPLNIIINCDGKITAVTEMTSGQCWVADIK